MKFSLVIPTRERAETLDACLDTAIAAANNSPCDVEIVVSDNASEDGTGQVVESKADSRIVYVNPQQRISMRENFEFALAAATGSHIIFSGDDDGFMPMGLNQLAKVIDAHAPEIVTWRMSGFRWPSDIRNAPGVLYTKPRSLRGPLEWRDPGSVLQEFAAGTVRNYRQGANIYHGCIARPLIERVKAKGGGLYFGGPIPDVYAAMAALTMTETQIAYFRHPFTMDGASDRSNGASTFVQRRSGDDGGQGAEFKRFVAEAQTDSVQGRFDISIGSVPLLVLDMLLMVRSTFGLLGNEIDLKVWERRVRKEFPRLAVHQRHAVHQALQIMAREDNFELDEAYSTAALSGSSSEADSVPAPLTETRIKVDRLDVVMPEKLQNVHDAAKMLHTLIGPGYDPLATNRVPQRLLAYLGLLRRLKSL